MADGTPMRDARHGLPAGALLLALGLAHACAAGATSGEGERAGSGGAGGSAGNGGSSGSGSTGGGSGGSGGTGGGAGSGGPCPPGMAFVADTFCIDRFEAALEEQVADGSWQPASPYLTVGDRTVRAVPADGLVPQGYISGAEAARACENAGKRLCTSDEWLRACQGRLGTTFPYGETHEAGACNDAYAGGHPVVDYFGTSEGVWNTTHMNDPGINRQPGTVAPGGSHVRCVSSDGVYDLHGNLHEWVDEADGTFRGGFYADGSINGPGCLYRTGAHAFDYHDYSTGFRCCATPSP